MDREVLCHTATARFLHWINAAAVGMLTLTGFYVHWPRAFPVFSGMDSARKLHFIFMYLVFFGIIVRVYYSFVSGDYKDIMFHPSDIKGFPALTKYYLFLTKSLPDFGKYNPGQKFLYTGWMVLLQIQAVTGFILYWPSKLAWLADPLGGLMVMRQVHYLLTWVFVITVTMHVYLAAIGGLAVIRSIFTGYMPAGAHLQPDSGEAEVNLHPQASARS